jgi:[CysO sulfur-carrier protein]-S-L-cysteine hydrolase
LRVSGLKISAALYQEMVEHALAEKPNECCGMIAAFDGEAVRVYRTTNIHQHPQYAYEADPREILRASEEIDREDWLLGAIYHSHPHSDPLPSQTDINLAYSRGVGPLWPGTIYIIVGLGGEEPQVRAFRIESDTPEEVALSVL